MVKRLCAAACSLSPMVESVLSSVHMIDQDSNA
jgi:hypothetical protein